MEDLLEFLLFAVPIAGGLGLGWYLVRKKITDLRLELARQAGRAERPDPEKAELEERVRVLERIVTDRGYSVAEEIEALRDTGKVETADSGVPLNIARKEKA
ncbi:hypothetical protein ACFCW2_09205 [Qipengyuania sp. DSG2-2]|uniref:hypothetical protein n=1 Tax=Qipengyuania sp. DGS2-2 TaxID=3349631 RepID=UPI0036D3D251